ncbi:hypothetical protein niasHT_034980 [Heterodera trifolii]|uniref:Uncharacterized protein n=1 Tax=Heterodera trifolii TaxID=157864 RepID=A0ABD2I8U8_9BILA
MPRSCSNSSSSDDSSKPDTARLSHWTNSTICGDKTTQYICTNASILAHQMLKFELIKKFRHHAVRVNICCLACHASFPRTYDFSGSGKHAKFVLLLQKLLHFGQQKVSPIC